MKSDKDTQVKTLVDLILEVVAAEGKIDEKDLPKMKAHFYKGLKSDK